MRAQSSAEKKTNLHTISIGTENERAIGVVCNIWLLLTFKRMKLLDKIKTGNEKKNLRANNDPII